ncbi:MAG TPA: SIS domain-containing protein [Actinomycetota bacterium]|jgi:phosphoheptose isomerase|nr:SIS domain-containing protein [Actinomycetota bacterium]HNL51498.1 SIS domain-containing protein [Actinomycetota bacterium]
MSPRTAARTSGPDIEILVDPLVQEHRAATVSALELAGPALEKVAAWGRRLAEKLSTGGRLLVCGNGGSAAEAQHLSAEIVGRFRDDRPAFSALALHAETSSLTAIANDYGHVHMYARQVEAHANPGDVLLLLSTSGRSPNLLEAADRANRLGVRTWGLTGPAPNPLAQRCDEAATVPSVSTSAIQEVHLVAVHVLCAAFDAALPATSRQVL